MYKIYGITQGQRETDLSRALPWVAEPGTKSVIATYLWCIKGEDTAILVDTGMADEAAETFHTAKYLGGARYLEDRLRKLGVEPADIEIVIVSHLHSDHFSAYQLYPKATFYIQRKEIEFFSGPGVKFRQVSQHAPNMSEVMSLAYANRIRYLDGNEQVAPGIRVVLVGGHTPGSQAVVVATSKGEAVICADAMDLYQNMAEGVVGMYVDLMPALFALDKIRVLASSPELIIPGHDPLVMSKFPNPIDGVVEIG